MALLVHGAQRLPSQGGKELAFPSRAPAHLKKVGTVADVAVATNLLLSVPPGQIGLIW